MDEVYEQCVIEARIDKIRQILLWYDNLPADEEIVSLMKEWNKLHRRLSRLMYDMSVQDAAGAVAVKGDHPPERAVKWAAEARIHPLSKGK